MSENEAQDTDRAFESAINMTADEMRRWLDTERSNEVGWTHEGEHEAVGHQSGRRILELLERGGGGARDEEEEHFRRRVVGYIHRHLAQRPDGDVSETRWRYSLMNWGHDPMKDDVKGASPEHRDEAPPAGAEADRGSAGADDGMAAGPGSADTGADDGMAAGGDDGEGSAGEDMSSDSDNGDTGADAGADAAAAAPPPKRRRAPAARKPRAAAGSGEGAAKPRAKAAAGRKAAGAGEATAPKRGAAGRTAAAAKGGRNSSGGGGRGRSTRTTR
jgi:hypothetical protein